MILGPRLVGVGTSLQETGMRYKWRIRGFKLKKKNIFDIIESIVLIRLVHVAIAGRGLSWMPSSESAKAAVAFQVWCLPRWYLVGTCQFGADDPMKIGRVL